MEPELVDLRMIKRHNGLTKERETPTVCSGIVSSRRWDLIGFYYQS